MSKVDPMYRPVFVLSTGRCGTLALQRFLQQSKAVEAFHRYRGPASKYSNDMQFVLEQNYAYYYVLRNRDENLKAKHFVIQSLRRSRSSLIQIVQQEGKVFIELNHGFSAFGRLLADAFPDAKFVHLVREPTAVVTSFMQKFAPPLMTLPAFMGTRYSLRGQYVLRYNRLRNFLRYGPGFFQDFVKSHRFDTHLHPFEKVHGTWQEKQGMDSFEKTCWYWNEINKNIMEFFYHLSNERKLVVYFEDIFNPNSEESKDLFLKFSMIKDLSIEDMKVHFMKKINEKEIYNPFPNKEEWTEGMLKVADYYCRDTMKKLGYS